MYLFVSISWRAQNDFWVGLTHIEQLVTEKNVFWIHLFDKNHFLQRSKFCAFADTTPYPTPPSQQIYLRGMYHLVT
jgi:hypothetical protein